MTRTIFWSWQSDAPKRETRDLIHQALSDAVAELTAEVEEAQRIDVDQGAKGVIGLEIIAEEILRKIDRAFAFVADISTVAVAGEGADRKRIANPNVMLELGYARKSLGRSRIIPVFNKAVGPTRFEDLPFDLRHMSGSIAYEVPQGAPTETLRRERASLQRQLCDRLRAMFASDEVRPPEPTPEWHPSLPHDPSIWAEAHSPLAVNSPHLGRIAVVVAPAPRIFVRLLPDAQRALSKDKGLFPSFTAPLMPIGFSSYRGDGRTGNGHVIFEKLDEKQTTKSIARWYKDNGEIWAISTWDFHAREAHPHLGYDGMIKDLVEWVPSAIRSSRAAGSSGSILLRLGACGLQNVQWWVSRPNLGANPFLGLQDCVTYECMLEDDSRPAVIDAVTGFMEELTDNFAVDTLTRDQVETFADSR